MNIFLTEKGRELADRIQREFRSYCMGCMEDFSDAEMLLFQQLLGRFQFQGKKS